MGKGDSNIHLFLHLPDLALRPATVGPPLTGTPPPRPSTPTYSTTPELSHTFLPHRLPEIPSGSHSHFHTTPSHDMLTSVQPWTTWTFPQTPVCPKDPTSGFPYHSKSPTPGTYTSICSAVPDSDMGWLGRTLRNCIPLRFLLQTPYRLPKTLLQGTPTPQNPCPGHTLPKTPTWDNSIPPTRHLP